MVDPGSRRRVGAPSQVAAATFPIVRRGADPDAVRRFLDDVAGEWQHAVDRVEALEQRLRDVEQSTRSGAVIDEDTAVRLLGEEAARILQTAREVSQQIRAKAEQAAAQLVRDATEDAARLRESAEEEAARRRSDAAADAEAELEMAKQQGREMVTEAREYREKVLADVARRREIARQQLEALVHGRERLVQAFERARLAAVDVIGGIAPLDGEMGDEVVNLDPTTGPVPVMVPARAPQPAAVEEPAPQPEVESAAEPAVEPAVESAVEPAVEPEPEPIVPATQPEPEPEAPVGLTVVRDSHDDRVIPLPARPAPPADDEPAADDAEPKPSGSVDGEDAPAGPTSDADDADDDADDDGHHASVVALFAGEIDRPTATDEASSETPSSGPSSAGVDDLFAKLRAASAEMVARDAVADTAEHPAVVASPGGDDTLGEPASDSPTTDTDSDFVRRDEAVVPIIVMTARKMKRVLAEEQNGLFDAVRRHTAKRQPFTDINVLLPPVSEHVSLYRSAIDEPLRSAALAGAASISTDDASSLERTLRAPEVLAPVAVAIEQDVVMPLRERLERCLQDVEGDADDFVSAARSVYREWKSEHIDEHVDDLVHLAYGRGAFAVLSTGMPVCWMVDPNGPNCPDAEDNALAGAVALGDPFPTGHSHPPAHAGCRCLLGRTAE